MSSDEKILGIITLGVLTLISILSFAFHLHDLHEEKMASMGCKQAYLQGVGVHWDCTKEKQ